MYFCGNLKVRMRGDGGVTLKLLLIICTSVSQLLQIRSDQAVAGKGRQTSGNFAGMVAVCGNTGNQWQCVSSCRMRWMMLSADSALITDGLELSGAAWPRQGQDKHSLLHQCHHKYINCHHYHLCNYQDQCEQSTFHFYLHFQVSKQFLYLLL